MAKRKDVVQNFDSERFYNLVRERLISMRKERGLKRDDLEVALGLTRSAVWRLEKQNNVTIPQIVALGNFYGFRPIEFLSEAIEEASNGDPIRTGSSAD